MFNTESKYIILGSIDNSDLPIIKDAMANFKNDCKYIIVPHEVNKSDIGDESQYYCEYGGYQLSGWVPGNDIIVKVWDASEDFEYTALATFADGHNDTWGDIYTVISELNADDLTQDVELDGVILNNISLNIQPAITNVDTGPRP